MITITATDPDIITQEPRWEISQGSVLVFFGEVTHQSQIHIQADSFWEDMEIADAALQKAC